MVSGLHMQEISQIAAGFQSIARNAIHVVVVCCLSLSKLELQYCISKWSLTSGRNLFFLLLSGFERLQSNTRLRLRNSRKYLLVFGESGINLALFPSTLTDEKIIPLFL